MPSVSVIIPCLNEEAQIAKAIASASKAGAEEIIVVDGGSTDATVAIARESARVVTSTKPGRAEQQNLGASLATGDVLLFLHADCRLSSDSIANVSNRLKTDDVVGGCFQQNIDASGLRFRIMEAGNAWRVRLLKWAYGDQGIFVRRNVFEGLSGFPTIDLMEDLYFMKKLKSIGRIVLLDSRLTVSARRWQQRGVLSQTVRNWLLISAAHLGVSPNRLAHFYKNVR